GSYIPFPDTDSEAAMTGDLRASVLARYGSASGYADAIEVAARRLVEERLMLEEDVERVVARAQDWGRPLHDVRL
ncbi:MAG: alpha/beta hydrolase domain-containing protein, partial [Chromatiales bacterium]|nr:alpha/beta hydrolase domain-containing protein [Chromatiales bacterium]